MKKLHRGDRVKVVKDNTIDKHNLGKTGVVLDLCPNPFLPDWLSSPNYNVKLDTDDGRWENDIFTRGELKLMKD